MDDKKITVIARIKAKQGMEKELKEALLALVEPTRKEEGCISYDLHQAADDHSLFYFYESWASREELDKHLQTPHITDVLARSAELLAVPPEIIVVNKIT